MEVSGVIMAGLEISSALCGIRVCFGLNFVTVIDQILVNGTTMLMYRASSLQPRASPYQTVIPLMWLSLFHRRASDLT